MNPRIILTGPIPVALLCSLVDAFSKAYPGAIALDAGHILSEHYGATMVLVAADDPVVTHPEGMG